MAAFCQTPGNPSLLVPLAVVEFEGLGCLSIAEDVDGCRLLAGRRVYETKGGSDSELLMKSNICIKSCSEVVSA